MLPPACRTLTSSPTCPFHHRTRSLLHPYSRSSPRPPRMRSRLDAACLCSGSSSTFACTSAPARRLRRALLEASVGAISKRPRPPSSKPGERPSPILRLPLVTSAYVEATLGSTSFNSTPSADVCLIYTERSPRLFRLVPDARRSRGRRRVCGEERRSRADVFVPGARVAHFSSHHAPPSKERDVNGCACLRQHQVS